MGLAALILGICGLVLGGVGFAVPFLGYLTFAASLLAIILGAVARSKAKKAGTKDGKATAGLVLGIISLALGIVVVIVAAIALAALVSGGGQIVTDILNNIPKT